jgi:hypothetical protein
MRRLSGRTRARRMLLVRLVSDGDRLRAGTKVVGWSEDDVVRKFGESQ